MRRYSRRERFLSAVAAALLLFIAATLTTLAVTDRTLPMVGLLSASVMFWGGGGVFAKIAVTGTSTTFLDRAVGPRGFGENPPRWLSQSGSFALDCLSAVAVNLVAFALAMFAAAVAISFPLGIFGVYLLLVGAYAHFQFRRGQRRRAVLAGVIAPMVVVWAAMSIRIS